MSFSSRVDGPSFQINSFRRSDLSPEEKASQSLAQANTALGSSAAADQKVTEARAAYDQASATGAPEEEKTTAYNNLAQAAADAQEKLRQAMQALEIANRFAIEVGRPAPFDSTHIAQLAERLLPVGDSSGRRLGGWRNNPIDPSRPSIRANQLLNRDDPASVMARVESGRVVVDYSKAPGQPGGPPRDIDTLIGLARTQPFNTGDPNNQVFNDAEVVALGRRFKDNPDEVFKAADPKTGVIAAPGSFMAYMLGEGGQKPATGVPATNPLLTFDSALGGYVRNQGINLNQPFAVWRSDDDTVRLTHVGEFNGNFVVQRNPPDPAKPNDPPTYTWKFQKPDETFGPMPPLSDAQKNQLIGVLFNSDRKGNRTREDGGDLNAYFRPAPPASNLPAGFTPGNPVSLTSQYSDLAYTLARNTNGTSTSITIDVPRNADGTPKDPRFKGLEFPRTFSSVQEVQGAARDGYFATNGRTGMIGGFSDMQRYVKELDPTTALLHDLLSRFEQFAKTGAAPAPATVNA